VLVVFLVIDVCCLCWLISGVGLMFGLVNYMVEVCVVFVCVIIGLDYIVSS